MNSDLTKRLNDLKKDIIHPEGMQVTQSQNYPFSIFVYSPEEEFIMRAKFQELILDIKKTSKEKKIFLKTIKTLTIHFNL